MNNVIQMLTTNLQRNHLIDSIESITNISVKQSNKIDNSISVGNLVFRRNVSMIINKLREKQGSFY